MWYGPLKGKPNLISKTAWVPKLLCIWGFCDLSIISFEIHICEHNFAVVLSLQEGVNLFYDDIGINFAGPI